MKQKRKENTCLHSNKQCLNAIGTVTLLGVVCGVLGIISVGLLTKSAMAVGGDGNTSTVAYTGVDDKIDVVVGLNFIDQINQSKDLYNFYESGDNLYVTPNNVVVNVTNTNGEIVKNNEVIGSVYGHVLGGEGNKLNSDNVTIIAGSSNEIGVGNTNAVLLGGTGNTMGGSEALALVGGEGNDANKKDGLIIGGNNNTVNGGNGSASVLGGERNEVLGDNAVVGGLGIRMAQSLKNVFAYSNRNVGAGNFITKSSDAFYLDIKSGLGINLESTKGGVEMQGAMGFGEVDINQGCNDTSNNYGVQGTWNGCMVGCTKAGGGKWQLLDSSESCKAKCKDDSNGRCVVDVYNPSEVAGKCSDAKVSKMNAEICEGRNPAPYKDVIFETTLIDSEGNCNGGKLKNNQCVYKCKQGYHLTGDNTGIIKSNDERKQKGMGCYKDCTLKKIDGSNGKKVKHNATVWGYDVKSEQCAYNDGVRSPASKYTCGDHYTQLLCVDGKFYKKSGGNWEDNNTTWYESCELNNYTCTASYNLSKSDITGTLKDSGTFGTIDRDTFTLTRAKYKLCIDWTAASKVNGTNCNPKKYNYQFIGCNTEKHYENVGGNVCKKKCKYGTEWVSNGQSRTFYSSSSETCMSTCQSKGRSLTCSDGEWGTASERITFKYTSCTQNPGNSCAGFDVSESKKEDGKKYKECVKEFVVGESCSSVKKYKLCEGDDCGEPDCEGDDCNEPDCEGDDCNEPSPSCEGDDCGGGYVCKGEYPEGVTTGSVAPDNDNTEWKCATDLTEACTFKCPSGWECDGTSACKEKNNSCEYVSSGPACSDGDPTDVIQGDCAWSWKCGDNSCSMTYNKGSLSVTPGEYKVVWSSLARVSEASMKDYQAKCREYVGYDAVYVDRNTDGEDGGTLSFLSMASCQGVVEQPGRGIIVDYTQGGKELKSRCDYKTVNVEYGCAACLACETVREPVSTYKDPYCEIGGDSVSAGDSRCAGIKNTCDPVIPEPDPEPIKYCQFDKWERKNSGALGCNGAVTPKKNLDNDDCWQSLWDYKWVRTQDFGSNAGGWTYDTWKQGDECAPGSIACQPCAWCECMDGYMISL